MNETVNTPNNNRSTVVDGSALYYALLYVDQHAVDQHARTRAIAVLQFIETLSRALYDVTEPQVAEKKIHWWHEELTRLAKQQSRHPAGIAVQDYLNRNRSIQASFAILSAAAAERYAPFTTDQTLNETLQTDYGARLVLLDEAMHAKPASPALADEIKADQPMQFKAKSELTGNASGVINSAESASITLALGQFDRINSLVKRLRCGYAVFSDERYRQYGLTPEDLSNYATQSADTQQKIDNLITSAVTETQLSLDSATDETGKLHLSQPVQLTVQILCQIRLAQLKLWKKRKPNLLTESVTLTPLRKFFIAYRCKRRFKHT